MREDILNFLKNEVQCTSAHRELAEKSGKNSNSTYKDINEHSIINAISLLRYWNAMQEIAREAQMIEQKIPKLNDLLEKYTKEIQYINGISDSKSLDDYIQENQQLTIQIINYFSKDITNLSKGCQELINKIHQDSTLSAYFRASKIERMKQV
ncbi:hypothetical protein ACIQ2D_04675 [Lysinibacillus sp. NPDC097287]|uniref:hypothetical protein n=1 Tax=Lysinibacillus sp. NPDC097287 TaxID=3364144 RepID=UPI003806278F